MNKFITAVALSISLTTTAHAGSNDAWWELGAAVLGAGITYASKSSNQDTRNTAEAAGVILGSAQDGIGMKKFITPSQYENNPVYKDWIKVPRVYNQLFPEMDADRCIYRMRAGMIEISEPIKGCYKYVAVHPNNFY